MSSTMQLARRSFIVSAAVAGGGFALGWRIPAGRAFAQTVGAATGADVGIWAVIQPDDTTIVRIARSEMGQGTLTGLAQLVADELDCDWKLVRAEYVSPQDNLAHKRAWGDMSTGGSRGIRGSVDYVRKGGAAARAMLIEAAAQRWGVPATECTAASSVITHTPSGRTLRYGEVAAAAAKLPVPADVKLKTPAEWKIIGKAVKRLDTVDKLSGKQVFAIDVQLPDMLNAAIAQCPVFGGKLKSFDADKIKAMPGVRQVVAVDDNAVAVVADKWYQAKTALAALADRLGRGRRRERGQRADRRAPEGRTGREGGRARPAARRRRGGACGGGEEGRGGLRRAVPRPRHHGADELHGEVRRRQGGDLGRLAERRRLAGRRRRGRGRQAGGREGEQAAPRRRLRPARSAGLHAPGRADRQAGAGTPGQADLVARGGYAARFLSADHAVQADRRARRRRQRDRPACAPLRAVDPRLSRAAAHGERRRSHRIPELDRGGVRLRYRFRTC